MHPLDPSARRALRGLDWANFFLADVRDGLGPYLAIYLLIQQRWDEASIGVVMTVMGVATIVAQTPAGALIDATRRKRAVMVAATALLSAACLGIVVAPTFWVVATAKGIMGVAASVFPPAIAAITLGIVGPSAFTARTGRNEAFNHAGNATAAGLAALTAWWLSPVAVFYLLVLCASGGVAATLAIPASAIDHDRARGFADRGGDAERPAGFTVLLESRPLLVFAASVTLFHFANAAMLLMVGEKLALGHAAAGIGYMSACIVIAQAVMVPVALLVGRNADRWGHKPIFLVALLVLPLRGILYTLADQPAWLLAVQALDGVGAGIFGALFPVVVADLTRGTGRFNVSQGAIATAQGIGAALSTTVAGVIQVRGGYAAAFLVLSTIALAGAALFALAMPPARSAALASAR